MGSVLGSIFGFGDKMKRRLRDAVSNPSDYAEMTADENRNEWNRNPDERSLGFFNPVPLGTMGNFTFRKALEDAVPSISRRDFLKKSGGIAAGAATAGVVPKLLRKFAAEEKPIAKEAADVVTQAAKEAPKYKYNSLKEYLDDVQMWAKEDFKAADLSGQGARYSKDEFAKRILLQDENIYSNAKEMVNLNPNFAKETDLGIRSQKLQDSLNAFSPQAKKEMSAWKEMRGRGWENIDDFSRESIGRGLMPNYNGSLVKNPANDTYHHYLPGQEGRISDGFNSLDEARNSMTKTLQKAFRNKIQNGF